MASNGTPPFPAVADVLFSIKMYMAAMLALFIGLCFDLQNPYWALTTVFVVSSPFSGASTSKAHYRLLGTVLGGAMTVILVPNLANSPELLTAAICLWIGLCLAISLLDRTPRSYAFMLAGYTAALTGFPIVDTPDAAFTYVAARVIEIAVGILCAALVSRIVFPRHVGPVLSARIDAWLRDGTSLIVGVLENQDHIPRLSRGIAKLAADAVELRALTTHLGYDTSNHREVVGLARTLQRRMVTMLPFASALSDALSAMSRATNGAYTPGIRKLLAEVIDWLNSNQALSEARRTEFLELIATVEYESASMPQGNRLLIGYIGARMRDVILIWGDCLDLRQDIVSGSRHELRWQSFGALPKDWPMHRDYGMAIHSGISAMLATGIVAIFWIMCGWAQGGTAAMMAGVLCCIFSTLDDPAPAMRNFLIAAILSAATAFCLQFGLLPIIHGYIPLAVVLGLAFLPGGVLMAKPKTFIAGLGFSMFLPTLMSLQDRLDLNFETFANANLAIIGGFSIAVVMTAVVRSMGAEWGAHRLQRAGWVDIAASARKKQNTRTQLSHRMIDRLGLIAPRLATISGDSHVLQNDTLLDLRNALNISELQRSKPTLGSDVAATVDVILDLIAAHYLRKGRAQVPDQDSRLISALDLALRQISDSPSVNADIVTVALTGLRYSLCADTTPFAANESRALDSNGRHEKVA